MTERARQIKQTEAAICFMAIDDAAPPLEWVKAWLMLRFGLSRADA
jgi:hypothetical protein